MGEVVDLFTKTKKNQPSGIPRFLDPILRIQFGNQALQSSYEIAKLLKDKNALIAEIEEHYVKYPEGIDACATMAELPIKDLENLIKYLHLYAKTIRQRKRIKCASNE